jgi:hypothetical protein
MDAGGPPDGWQGRSEPSSRRYVAERERRQPPAGPGRRTETSLTEHLVCRQGGPVLDAGGPRD